MNESFARNHGFSLIELAAVLLLAGLLAAGAAVSLSGPRHSADRRVNLHQIVAADTDTRAQAQAQRRALQLVIDLDRKTITRHLPGETDYLGRPRTWNDLEVEVNLSLGGSEGYDPRAWLATGEAVITVSAEGRCPDYAWRWRDELSSSWRYVLQTGVTALSLELQEEADLESLYES